MITATREFTFDAAHRVLGHLGKCRHLHGHRYVAEVTVISSELDQLGMVVDFSVMKDLIGKWIDGHWDHNILLNEKDPLAILFTSSSPIGFYEDDLIVPSITKNFDVDTIFNGKDPYLMPQKRNPTAENIAEDLFYITRELMLPYKLVVHHIRIYETAKCWADYYNYNLSMDKTPLLRSKK